MRTAKAWQKIPSEWDELSKLDKAEMMAYDEREADLMSYRED